MLVHVTGLLSINPSEIESAFADTENGKWHVAIVMKSGQRHKLFHSKEISGEKFESVLDCIEFLEELTGKISVVCANA